MLVPWDHSGHAALLSMSRLYSHSSAEAWEGGDTNTLGLFAVLFFSTTGHNSELRLVLDSASHYLLYVKDEGDVVPPLLLDFLAS